MAGMKRLLMTVLFSSLLAGCALPSLEGRTESFALSSEETRNTVLGKALQGYVQEHPGLTGIHPLADARDAFAARALLAATAEKTLDVQYYIWRADVTGALLLNALYQAAERGVRVRLLLDDNGIAGMDELLAALNSHPNIEVRLFNPFTVRSPKAIGYVTHFSRANRRMHNKSFTADNQATIVGGRNVGDEYFGATEGILFADLDVVAVGEVVPHVSTDFDRYWASDSSYPVERLLGTPTTDSLKQIEAAARNAESAPNATRYVTALRDSRFVSDMIAGQLAFSWAPAKLVSDDPRKGLGEAGAEDLLMHRMAHILGAPKSRVDLVSPYFVPTRPGVEAFSQLAEQGVKIRILTNALEATDVAAVHAGYEKRRKPLLKAGIELFEMRQQGEELDVKDQAGVLGSSGSSLHAKTFAVDNKRVFVGSFNFDPRSAKLNTEMGLIIEDRNLADAVARAFDEQIPANAYEVLLDEKGQLYWLERSNGEEIIYHKEPGTGILKRSAVRFLSWLPIEWLL